MRWDLGAGETDVLAHAVTEKDRWCLLDDRAARRAATAFGLHVIGTLGLVVHAARAGVLSDAGEAIGRLRAAGLHLSDRVVHDALARLEPP
jgi:predicted nucleic acid-binding protein